MDGGDWRARQDQSVAVGQVQDHHADNRFVDDVVSSQFARHPHLQARRGGCCPPGRGAPLCADFLFFPPPAPPPGPHRPPPRPKKNHHPPPHPPPPLPPPPPP